MIKERFDSSVDYRTKINNILSKLKERTVFILRILILR
ncbi:hypothetical protein AMCSP20_001079 [Streptococcus pneumoniae 2090008]|nr:hypothetical protein AMCSP20_001079 [Streptococcus pneumoniae 2090008]